GGAARIAPLVYFCRHELSSLVEAVRLQTALTHTDPDAVAAAEFFGRVARQVLDGVRPVAAVTEVTMHRFRGTALEQWVEAGMSSRNSDTVEAINRLGPACATPGAFAGVVHLVTRYENDLREALVQNVMAGGDSAARGLITGMVLGAHLGLTAVPDDWLAALRQGGRIGELLEATPPV
nr:ADP-ribosylglycohydrolase family protein [Desulfuromonadales bacterium]NIR34362.1 ADP-ribosylglycohydrolase family protein [Desulfuromonadales bacterium]NIS44323.1 ADP-ribosylglycohydrolase family protein [Desulfuromonadales bacterium]